MNASQFEIGDKFIYVGPMAYNFPEIYEVTRICTGNNRVYFWLNNWETWLNGYSLRKLTPLELALA